jgi:manganese oxidase
VIKEVFLRCVAAGKLKLSVGAPISALDQPIRRECEAASGRNPSLTCMRCSTFLICLLLALPGHATTRHYYIAAEDLTWDYAPSGRDLLYGRPIPQPWSLRTQWPKTRYIEYTDATFSVRKPQPEWLGILGPVIRAEVGDEIIVDFLNRSQVPHSIHPHGLRYDKANEGSFYLPWGSGAKVLHNGRFTYRWYADEGSGPGPGQLSSVVWWYHSHVDPSREINAGLLGPIIISGKGKARPDASPRDVDREFVTAFMIFDELAGKNEGQFHSINGYVFGNLPGLVMKRGEKVRWYVMGMGNEKDLHTPHWHGKTVTDGKRNMDVIELLPGSMVAVDMLADNPGTWMFHCHVADHMEAGMMASFTIYEPETRSCPLKFESGKFWNQPDKYSLTVENTSGKSVKAFTLNFQQFIAPQFMKRPFQSTLASDKSLGPGQQQKLELDSYQQSVEQGILGWVFYPSRILFSDGSAWTPQQRGECFQAYWRDPEHPDLKVLPPEQVETNSD